MLSDVRPYIRPAHEGRQYQRARGASKNLRDRVRRRGIFSFYPARSGTAATGLRTCTEALACWRTKMAVFTQPSRPGNGRFMQIVRTQTKRRDTSRPISATKEGDGPTEPCQLL